MFCLKRRWSIFLTVGRIDTFWRWMFKFVSGTRSCFEVLGVWATNCAIFVPWHMTHAKLHSNINVFFSQMNGTHVEKCLQFNVLGVGCTHLFPVLGTVLESMERGQRPVQFLWPSTWYKRSYVSISAYFWSFNGRYPRWRTKTMAQMWRCLKELWRNWINVWIAKLWFEVPLTWYNGRKFFR